MSDPSTPHTKLGEGEAANNQPSSDQPNQLVRHQSWKVVEEFTAAKEVVAEAQAKKKAGVETTPGDRLAALKKEVDMTEHIVPIDSIYAQLNTSPTTGLTAAQAARLLEEGGPNELSPPETEPEWKKLARHLFTGFSLLLWGGGIFAFIAYWIDSARTDTPDTANVWLGVALLGVVIITGLFAYYQERSSSAIMAGFKKLVPQQALVIRDGEPTTIAARDIVLGDIVEIRAGDKIPADLRMIKVNGLKVDNSSLTGEAEPQSRSVENTDANPLETKNLAFYSTLATNGSATGVVISRGDDTIIGRIAGLVSNTENVETPIAREIAAFVHIITVIAVILGVIFFIAGLFVYSDDFLTNVISVIGIIVANVPEGLLATVTVALTLTAKKMASKNVLVKQLEAVETLGSTTTICSDKTGTLTQNRMTVSHLFYDGAIKTASPIVSEGKYDKDHPSFKALLRVATVCNRATFDPSDHTTSVLDRRTTGDASESALIKFAEPLNGIIETRNKNPNIADVPFNSSNKFAVNIIEEEGTGKLVLTMKGAPERIIDRCSTIMKNGEVVELTDEDRAEFQGAYDTLGGQGERVLGFCHFYLDPEKFSKDYEFETDAPYNFPLEGLTFLGLISLIDPPRDTVPDAVRKCQSAGIKVIMVTGDHPLTAKAIAKQVGIIRDEDLADYEKRIGRPATDEEKTKIKAVVVNGAQLREMTEDDLDKVMLHQQIVFARTSPTQKLRIVEACQRRKEVVAVTGDGVNDSPALKKADIGVAMGISGSDVSKEAANMILLDDNFASIVNGVEEGRLIFDNLKKSIAYTLSSNIPEISPFIFFILLQLPIPLTTVLILGIDLGTDLLPAISLAYEKAESDIMNRPPRNAETDALVTNKLIAYSYLQIGMMQATAGFYTYFVVMADFGFRPGDLIGAAPYFIANSEVDGDAVEDLTLGDGNLDFDTRNRVLRMAQSAFFVSIIIVQWADLLITKTRKLSLFQQGMRNGILTAGLFEETILGILLIYLPFFNNVFRTLPIRFVHWLPALPWSVLIFVYDEIRKYLIRQDPTGWVATVTYY